MLANVRPRLTYANVAATAALVLGCAGFATAASPQASKVIRGCYLKANGALRIVKSAKSCHRNERPIFWNQRGLRGLRGLVGPRGLAGAQGAQGAQGPKGDTGPAGPFSTTLPSGQTLRGAYAVSGTAPAAEVNRDAQSYSFRLGFEPLTHFIAMGAPPPPQCPGTADAPEATAGNLCVYEHFRTGTPSVVIDYPSNTGTTGFIVQVSVAAAGEYQTRGNWAVTAP